MTGNLIPDIVQLAVNAPRPSLRLALSRSVEPTEAIKLYIRANEDDAREDALVALDSLEGEIQLMNGDLDIFATLSPENLALLSPTRLYHLLVDLVETGVDTEGGEFSYFQSFVLVPVNHYIESDFPMSLSTRYLNTVPLAGSVGGSGFLDGLSTVNQGSPCLVTFKPDASAPETWQLESGDDDASDSVIYPLDRDDENPKFWRKIG